MLIYADFPLTISRQINFSELPSAAGLAIAQLLQLTAEQKSLNSMNHSVWQNILDRKIHCR